MVLNMDFLLYFLNFLSLYLALVSGTSFTEFAYPNFNASNLRFVDAGGSFLFSRHGTFKAAMLNPGGQQNRFYLCIIHSGSNSIIWSANRDSPVSKSGIVSLTTNGISISEEGETIKWSTPTFNSSVSALQLTETGNLVLLDGSNASLWESFRNPTDTLVIGQLLHIETALFSAVSSDDLSTGDYELALTMSDAILQWQSLTYWKLSMDTKSFRNSNYAVEFMALNQTGLYLFGQNGSAVVSMVKLPPSEFRTAKMDSSGQFIISSFPGGSQKQEFVGPDDECQIPYICGKIGLCTHSISVDGPVCSCPLSFRGTSNNSTNCVPADSSYLLPVFCNSTNNTSHLYSSNLSYLQLGYDVDYFANDFTTPIKNGVNLSQCQDLCSEDCTCLGFFYDNSSGSCHILANELGSFILGSTSNGRLGFIKSLVRASPNNFAGFGETGFPKIAAVLFPLSSILFLFTIGILLWRRFRLSNTGKVKSSFSNFQFSGDLEFSITGLPSRFDYEELKSATESFKTQIGTGGFGTVYKGILPDKTPVAVKKITVLGVRGKKDFCTEIAIIGNIHHVNLVKLKGYCAQRRQWLLVYEYMNRGSLDKSLFGSGPVLEWQDRVEIAVGTARGLAYLHSGCEKKIIHCDVKPENILLHDHFQAKISDFGLSKLLSPEQSSLITTMRGTRGYLAPEWLTSSAISDKTDVYSFGMVLLEIVSGKKNCSARVHRRSHDENSSSTGGNSSTSAAQEIVYFPLFALEMHEQKRYLELIDPRLEGRVRIEDVEKFIRVALCCVHEEPGLRPSMVAVVGMLDGNMAVGNPRIESLNFLRFYGRRFTEVPTVEETRVGNDDILYPDANASDTMTKSGTNPCFSYVSSQQVSGPR